MNSLIYRIARGTVAAVWFYHGLVPKLIVRHPDEFTPLLAAGFSTTMTDRLVLAAGLTEMIFALLLLIFWKWRGGLWLTIALMSIALIGVTITTPRFLGMAFNPFSLNLCMIALAAVALLAQPHHENV